MQQIPRNEIATMGLLAIMHFPSLVAIPCTVSFLERRYDIVLSNGNGHEFQRTLGILVYILPLRENVFVNSIG